MSSDFPDHTFGVTVNVHLPAPSGTTINSKAFEDANFTSAESPRTLDVNAALGRNGQDGYIICNGLGDIKVQFSNDGISYGDQHTLKEGWAMSLKGLDIDSIKITWVSDSSYYILVV